MYVLCIKACITCTLFSARQQNVKENKSKRARNEEDKDGGDDRCEYESDIEPVEDTSTLRDKGNMVSNSMQLLEI